MMIEFYRMVSPPATAEVRVACPACGGGGPAFFVERGRRFERCRCGLVFQNPRPSAEWIRSTPYAGYPDDERQMIPIYEHAMTVLPRGRVLDVGCGGGGFVRRLRARGWDAHGIDFPVDFLTADLEGPFDAITAIYVLEHVVDPRAFVAKTARLLRPGGMAYVRVPHTSPIVRLGRLVAPRWNFYNTPWHLQDFPPRVLKKLFEGWDVKIDRTPTRRAWLSTSYSLICTRGTSSAAP